MSTHIHNGQFWKDGKIVRPEFGNLEQIKALRWSNIEAEWAATDGIETIHDYGFYHFTCLCDKEITVDSDLATCPKCRRGYIIQEDCYGDSYAIWQKRLI